MAASMSLPPQLQLSSEAGSGREQSATTLTPRRRSSSINNTTDMQRSHSVPPHVMSTALRQLPASPTVSETSTSHNGSFHSSSTHSASSAAHDDEMLDTLAGALVVEHEPRLVKSTSTPAGLSRVQAITRSASAATTSSAPSLPSPASLSASSSAHSSSSCLSTASLVSSTLASLSSTVASLFRPSSPTTAVATKSASPTPAPARHIPYFTADAVAQHNTAASFWTVVHGRVYDLTTYLQLHPGGYRLLFKNAGADSTSDFVGLRHSKRAVAILDAYWIGDLVGTKPMRDVPAGLGSAVRAPSDGCVAAGSFSAGKKAGGGGGMLGDALRIGESMEGVRRSHSAGPGNNGRVAPLHMNTKFQTKSTNSMPPPRARADNTISQPASSPSVQSPPALTINLITPPDSSPLSASSPTTSSPSLDASLSFTVSSVKHLAADTVQLVFRLPPSSASASFAMPLSGHVTIEIPSPLPSTEPLRRQYTPIASTPSSFTLLVKRYTAQQLGSHYLASLAVGQSVAVHGPYTSLAHSLTAFTDVLLFAMGSGITPMYQLLQHVHKLSTASTATAATTPRMHLLYSARARADVWLRQPLDNVFAQHQPDWHHTYLLSSERGGRLDAAELSDWLQQCGVALRGEPGRRVLCCVCGSDEYAEAVSGWLREPWRTQSGGGGGGADSGLDIHIF